MISYFKGLINSIVRKVKMTHYLPYVNMALSKAAATIPLRKIDPSNPSSWEFSGFSQNGEDGIIDYLLTRINKPNRYFIEIGSANGLENNTSWLAIARRYSGLMVESNEKLLRLCKLMMQSLNIGIECRCLFLNKENVKQFLGYALHNEPDVFSLDIDGNDYYVAKPLLELGLRPKIFVVEYNSAFGPEKSITIKYEENFYYHKAHRSGLYYGVSVKGWKKLFESFGYRFVTVDLNGTNCFFIDPEYFDRDFVNNLKGLEFQENFYQLNKFKFSWDKQFKLIENMDYEKI